MRLRRSSSCQRSLINASRSACMWHSSAGTGMAPASALGGSLLGVYRYHLRMLPGGRAVKTWLKIKARESSEETFLIWVHHRERALPVLPAVR